MFGSVEKPIREGKHGNMIAETVRAKTLERQ
jgi:hypothetical protein